MSAHLSAAPEITSARAPVLPAVRSSVRRGPFARDALLRRLLAVADAGAAAAAAAVLALAGAGVGPAATAFATVPLWIFCAKLYGLYDRDHRVLRHLTVDELPTLLVWTLTCVSAIVLAGQLVLGEAVDAVPTLWAFAVALATAVVARAGARYAWRRLTPPERAVIVGSDPVAAMIRRKLELFTDIHVEIVADVPHTEPDRALASAPVDRIILASASIDEALIAHLVARCRERRMKLSVVPPARGMFGTAVQLRHIADLPVIEYNTWDVSRSTLLLKRALDLVGAAVALVVVAPLMLAIAVAVRLDSRGPVLFVQRRVGLDGRAFAILKFRTMVAGADDDLSALVRIADLDAPAFKLPRDPRVTRIGRLLRRTSLDELPQLLNVLRGDMSLVGPRPEQVEVVDRYAEEHRLRLAVKPGLTGPMQVYGRGALTFEERLAVEREYIENLSIGRDLRLLALTLPSVVNGRGAF